MPEPGAPGGGGGRGPLAGLRVLELGHFVAAPFCTRLLGDLGADVIKVEPPGAGDPVRQWGARFKGESAWWSVHGRNKRCVTLDLKKPRAREIVLQLAARSDALVENFRPGQLEKLGLGEAALRAARPDLVIARISGYGQDGPQRDRAAFGVIGEAVGGLRHLTNHPPGTTDLPPVRVGISIGDSVAGIYAAFGVMAALWRRDAAKLGDGRGRRNRRRSASGSGSVRTRITEIEVASTRTPTTAAATKLPVKAMTPATTPPASAIATRYATRDRIVASSQTSVRRPGAAGETSRDRDSASLQVRLRARSRNGRSTTVAPTLPRSPSTLHSTDRRVRGRAYCGGTDPNPTIFLIVGPHVTLVARPTCSLSR